MMELTLAVPIYVTRQLDRMTEATGFSLGQLHQLADHYFPALGVITEDYDTFHRFDLIELEYLFQTDEDGEHWREKTDLQGIPYLTGNDAILWLCEQKGLDIAPLTNISIPDGVFSECEKDQWYDISSFYVDVVRQNRHVSIWSARHIDNIITRLESRVLWQNIEYLEAGHIGNSYRRWDHGRMMRSLNDVGYSLVDGWSAAMKDHFSSLDDKEVREEKLREQHKKLVKRYTEYYMDKGMGFVDAMFKAHDVLRGCPKSRPLSVEGMGIRIYDPFPQQIIADFLANHKLSFVRSEEEQRLYDRIQSGEDLDTVFEDSMYELDGREAGFEHWTVAVANVMIRETGLSFGVHIADPDGKYKNRSCIMFGDCAPWLYNEKEKKLSRNMLYQIFDRYALELGLTVWEGAYFLMDFEDE